jgi:lysozyme
MPLNGYDISAYQAQLDPASVPGDFVIIKATGGDGYVNPSWRQQLAAAKAARKLVGIYHFARDGYTAATAHSEAQWFIRNAGDVLDGTVMVVLDWEGDNETDVGYAKAWLDEVTAATGVKPVIYMSFKTIQAANWAAVADADYGLWEAAYVLGYQRIDGYTIPGGRSAIPYWPSICMWQYTSSGFLPGWGSALDLDVFYGDATTWAAYCAKNGVTLAATGTEPLTPEEDIMASIDDLKAAITSPEVLEAIGKTIATRPVPYFDPQTGTDTGNGTRAATVWGFSDYQHVQTRNAIAALAELVKQLLPNGDATAQAAYDEFLKKLEAITIKIDPQA